MVTRRLGMSALGAGAGFAFYILSQLSEADIVSDRGLLGLGTATAVFFGGLLIMAGPLGIRRAALGAVGIALAVTVLLLLASLRFVAVEDMFQTPQIALAGFVLATVPLPFWIAANGAGWRSYPTLFGEAWSIVVRGGAACAFLGVVWGVIFLSDALLQVVGLRVIQNLLDVGPVAWLITGAVLGFGLAVVQELSDYVSPYLVLRLLRLLLPIVLVVTAVFLLALPLRGVSGLFGGLSVAFTLLAMAGAAATLVTTAVDQDDAQATQSAVLSWAARGMAVMLPVLAALGAWAVALRIGQYGVTPARVFAAEVAVLSLCYGVFYAVAVLRGAGWMARIRRANIWMAVALIGVAGASLTPALDAEAMSVRSQAARLEDGRLTLAQLDVELWKRWGVAGAKAVAVLEERAKEPGQEALAQRLLNQGPDQGQDMAALLAQLVALLPLQPQTATATRDGYLAALDAYQVQRLIAACDRVLPNGAPGCVMVVGDLLPASPGEEAILASREAGGYVVYESYAFGEFGVQQRSVLSSAGPLPQDEAGVALIMAWQAAPPATSPVPIRQFATPEGGLFVQP